MRQRRHHRYGQLFSTVVAIILLPYIVTVFINGPAVLTGAEVGEDYLFVEVDGKSREIPVEEYAIGILAREIPVTYEKEALEAQAVMLRTRMYKQITEEGKSSIFTDKYFEEKEMRKQWGRVKYEEYRAALRDVWQATEGQVLTYRDVLITTPFHQLSNGRTRSGNEVFGGEGYPYLQIRECPKDVEAIDQTQTMLIEKGDYEVLSTDSAGYVLQIREGEKTMTGEEFRQEKGLASACFALQEYEDKIRVTTQGNGHGIGLSQNMANEMAKEGKTHEEILAYFFADTVIREVAEIL
ncbi:hypothetical protein KFE17_11295 [Faecalicatena sp. Marseille-Q4148]|nr:hypothetical protein KFE17_11295 [Faecalicatena sp. Marseille-Q4148]